MKVNHRRWGAQVEQTPLLFIRLKQLIHRHRPSWHRGLGVGNFATTEDLGLLWKH